MWLASHLRQTAPRVSQPSVPWLPAKPNVPDIRTPTKANNEVFTQPYTLAHSIEPPNGVFTPGVQKKLIPYHGFPPTHNGAQVWSYLAEGWLLPFMDELLLIIPQVQVTNLSIHVLKYPPPPPSIPPTQTFKWPSEWCRHCSFFKYNIYPCRVSPTRYIPGDPKVFHEHLKPMK